MLQNSIHNFKISVPNEKISNDIISKVSRVSVNSYLEPPCSFELVFSDNQMSSKGIESIESIFAEGMVIEIGMGYGSSIKTIIKGEISAIEASFSNNEPVKFFVSGFDFMHRLSRGTATRTFHGNNKGTGMADSDIVKQLASEFGISAITETTAQLKKARVQNNISNLSFLKYLAEINGFYIWIENDSLCFKKNRLSNATTVLEWGKNLIEFNARLSIAGLVKTFSFQGWDEMDRKAIKFSEDLTSNCISKLYKHGKDVVGQSSITLNASEIYSEEAAQNYTRKIVGDASSIITATGTINGNPDITAGNRIYVNNVGRFSGEYEILEANHVLDGISGYMTSFKARSMP